MVPRGPPKVSGYAENPESRWDSFDTGIPPTPTCPLGNPEQILGIGGVGEHEHACKPNGSGACFVTYDSEGVSMGEKPSPQKLNKSLADGPGQHTTSQTSNTFVY